MLGTNSQWMGDDENISLSLQEERKKEGRRGKKRKEFNLGKKTCCKES